MVKGNSDIAVAREDFLKNRPGNLSYLIRKRYEWMLPFTKGKEKVIELGGGAAFSKDIFPPGSVIVTDVFEAPWLDAKLDAMALPFPDNTVDVLICSAMIHHLASPILFLEETRRALKPGGYLLINEPHTSVLMRSLLYFNNHEGWNYDIDIFDRDQVISNPQDAWSSNNAVAELLFRDKKKFGMELPGLKIRSDHFNECLIFLISGGVTAKFKTIQMPYAILKLIDLFDEILVRVAPSFFSLGRKIVIQKE